MGPIDSGVNGMLQALISRYAPSLFAPGAPADATPVDLDAILRDVAAKNPDQGYAKRTGFVPAADNDPARAIPPFETRTEPSMVPSGAPFGPPAPLGPPTPRAEAPAPAVAPTLTPLAAPPKPAAKYEPSMIDNVANFLAGLGRGNAILPSIGEGIKGVRDPNATATFLASKGATPEEIEGAMANPLLFQQLLKKMFPDKFTKLAPGEALFNNVTGAMSARNEPKLAPIPAGGSLYDPDKGKIVASVPKELSATEQNEIFKADAAVMASKNAQDALRKATELSKSAYSGWGARGRADIVNNIPVLGATKSAKDTVLLDNTVNSQALEQLKAIFGGNPTEGERKILLQIQGASSETPEVREKIYAEAMDLAKKREAYWANQAKALRDRTYLKPGGDAPGLTPDPLGLR